MDEQSCKNCVKIDVCIYYDRIEVAANGGRAHGHNGVFGMFRFLESNNVVDVFAEHCGKQCIRYAPAAEKSEEGEGSK